MFRLVEKFLPYRTGSLFMPNPGWQFYGRHADRMAINEDERRLRFGTCTRARDQLHVSAVRPGSEFLQDFLSGSAQ